MQARIDRLERLTAGPVFISKVCMAAIRPPETGTLVIAALLLLVLGFAGYWIVEYANPGLVLAPWRLALWFLIGAAVIIVLGFLYFIGGTSKPRDR